MKLFIVIIGIVSSFTACLQKHFNLLGIWQYKDSSKNIDYSIKFDSNNYCRSLSQGMKLLDDQVIVNDGDYKVIGDTLIIAWYNKIEKRKIVFATPDSIKLDDRVYMFLRKLKKEG